MKKLSNHTLIYDSECPLCDLYTRGFIKSGMLDENGRVMYGCAKVPASFDNERARNEIALVDYETGTVMYGIDSLVKILGHSFPVIGGVAAFWPVRIFLEQLYSFISYNRKVIAPAEVFEKRGSCTPAYHLGYRIAYIVFAWIVSSLILTAYATPLTSFLVGGGQIIFQMVFVRFMTRDRLMHYIGNMMTVSLIGALLLLPMLIVVRSLHISHPLVSVGWAGLVVTFMHYLHWRRVKKLGISTLAVVTWVVYNALVLFILS